MTKSKRFITAASITIAMSLMWGCSPSGGNSQMGYGIPQDVQVSCPLTSAGFSTWFADSTIAANGIVTPANSVNLVTDSNCNFYRWAEQMFLWITSPINDSAIVMESPTFYMVQPDTDNIGNQSRILVKNSGNTTLRAVAQIKKNTIGRTRIKHNAKGQAIGIETETGQATNDLLVAQNGSLVYYILFVNDVYAYYQAGVAAKLPGFDSMLFPTTQTELNAICSLANACGDTLRDSNALAMEMKTSWVEVNNLLANPESYIQVNAIIPTYTATSDTTWVLSGERPARLAMVGMHVVGSTAGHPEMVWATFEHKNNAPNASYPYIDTNGNTKTVQQDTGNHWLLSNNATDTLPNVSHQHWSTIVDTINGKQVDSGVIQSSSAFHSPLLMSASNTLRTMPWGSDPTDSAAAASNSQIISLNNAVNNLLPSGDIRKNYFLIGSTWTNGGTPPNGTNSGSDSSAIGTNTVANSTMETYLQGSSFTCFTCHSGFVVHTNKPDTISHIFADIVPISLTKAPASMNKKK